MLHEALEIISKEPCINPIKHVRIFTGKSPMIAIVTFVNDYFKIFPDKIFRYEQKKDMLQKYFIFIY